MKSFLLKLAALGGATAFVLPLPRQAAEAPGFIAPVDGTAGFSMPLHHFSKRNFGDPAHTKASLQREMNRVRLKHGSPRQQDALLEKRQMTGIISRGPDT